MNLLDGLINMFLTTYRVLMVDDAPCGSVFTFAVRVEAYFACQARQLVEMEFPGANSIKAEEVL